MAVFLSIDIRRVYGVFVIFIRRFLFGKKYNYKKLIMEVMEITEAYRKGEALEGQGVKTKDEFLNESITLLSDGILEKEEAVNMLIMRNSNMLEINESEANKFKTLAKFPPAFGMIGTTMGMIALLANLGGEDALKLIGPAMAVALITTLYGALLANLIFIPIAENLMNNSDEIYKKNEIVIEGVKLMLEKTNPIIVAEQLNSYLPPKERLDWKEVVR
jgi:chemotaxis protein MotA